MRLISAFLEWPSRHIIIHLFFLCVVLSYASGSGRHIHLELNKHSMQYEDECDIPRYFRVETVNPCQDLHIQVYAIRGRPSIYASMPPNEYPDSGSLAWASKPGTDYVRVPSYDPDYVIGTLYFSVVQMCSLVDDNLNNATHYWVQALHVDTDHPLRNILNANIIRMLSAHTYHHYRLCIPEQCVQLQVEVDTCRDPNVCPNSYTWPDLYVSRQEYPNRRGRSWRPRYPEDKSVLLNPSDVNFCPGHYYIGVYWDCTPLGSCANKTTCGPCWAGNVTQYSIHARVTHRLADSVCRRLMLNRRARGCLVAGVQSLHMNCHVFNIILVALSVLCVITNKYSAQHQVPPSKRICG